MENPIVREDTIEQGRKRILSNTEPNDIGTRKIVTIHSKNMIGIKGRKSATIVVGTAIIIALGLYVWNIASLFTSTESYPTYLINGAITKDYPVNVTIPPIDRHF